MKSKTKGNMKHSVTERVDSKKNGRQKEEHEEINENEDYMKENNREKMDKENSVCMIRIFQEKSKTMAQNYPSKP